MHAKLLHVVLRTTDTVRTETEDATKHRPSPSQISVAEAVRHTLVPCSPAQGFLYRPVYFYRYPAVRVYRSGTNDIPLLTARIQIPNQNRIYKW
jgi:hypothetical protein